MLSFHITQDLKDSLRFIIVEIGSSESGPKKILYRDTLKSLARPHELAAINFLIDHELRFMGMSSMSSAATTLALNRLHVPAKHVFQLMKHLSVVDHLFFKGKKIKIELIPSAELIYEARSSQVEGKLRIFGKEKALVSCEWIFPSSPPFCLLEGIIYFFVREIDWKWIDWVYPNPKILSEKQWENFKDQFEDGDLLRAPNVIWGEDEKKAEQKKTLLPCLVLKDRSGAFADLWMEYPEGRVAFHDPTKTAWRDLESEKYWEKDFLETDFVAKIVSDSHYYCPLDKVGKSLSFLLELGWTVIDYRGKQVIKSKNSELDLALEREHLVIQGKLNYGEYSARLKDVIGAFNRREKFIELSSTAVGLLEEDFFNEVGPLNEELIIGDKVQVRKSRLGLYDSLFQTEAVAKDEKLSELKLRLDPEKLRAGCVPTALFHGQLHPYQQSGLDWLKFIYEQGFGGLLADEMGLGKTVQVLALLSFFSEEPPTLIIAPTSLIYNWRKEFEKFLPQKLIYIHQGAQRHDKEELLNKESLILTSYALLRQDQFLFEKLHYSAVILDEAQWIKNADSQTAQITFKLQAKMRLAITGTPIENRLEDLWSIFHFLQPELLGEKKSFQNLLQLGESNQRHLQNLKKKIRPFVLRRTKEILGDQLPQKSEQIVWVEMSESQRNFYESVLQSSRQGLLKKIAAEGAKTHRMEILEILLRLRQICCHPHLVDCTLENASSGKMDRVLEELEELAGQGKKVLVYSQFTRMLRLLEMQMQRLNWSYVYLDGDTKNRETVIESFQNDERISIFLISLKAGGVGLNLTAADYVFLFDPWWNEAVEEQAIDRAHRLGRKETVFAKRFITGQSIEEKILKLKAHKTALRTGFLDFENEINALDINDLLMLLQD